MAYEVIARKWQPQTFADVVGQQHIIKTLQNELLQNRMAHAYLFVGPRGIGKTTIARIFAKAMNCHQAPTAEPCCQCQSCQDIATGNNLDLIEIDGASNNSVDDIRQLREEVLYSPVNSRYKVYIIDEVHMLSANAWNALLKTIEEPPAHAKFLFATTEAHKVLPTVVSRCQRFDLQRITFKLIIEQLQKIAMAENIKITDEALEVIARAAEGGMRDAQSLLDQMTAFVSADNSQITADQVLVIFGMTSVVDMEKLIIAILGNDKPGVISSIHQLALQGKNLEKLFDDILTFLRGIQICQIIKDPATILETGDDMIQLYQKVGKTTAADTIQKLLEYFSPVGRSLREAMNKQVFLESILLKGMRMAHAVDIEDLISRLNQLRKGEDLKVLSDIPAMPPALSAAPAPDTFPTPPVSAPQQKAVENTESSHTAAVPAPNSSPVARSEPPPAPVSQKTDTGTEPQGNQYPSADGDVTPSVDDLKKNDSVNPGAPAVPVQFAPQAADQKIVLLENPKPGVSPVMNRSYSPESLWHSLILEMDHCKQPMLKAYMQQGKPESLTGGTLTVVYDDDSDNLCITELRKEKKLLELRLKKLTGFDGSELNLVTKKGVTSPHETVHPRAQDLADIRKRVENNQFVKDTMDLFNGEIVDVRG